MINIHSIWKQLHLFQSASATQSFLTKCYQEKLNKSEAELKAYNNCYPFIYYLDQSEVFYNQANVAPLSIKPIMLFYGLVHLIKACILTVDPDYPKSTSVLAHGVSTRKRKKRNYNFFHDQIQIQKNGLCTYFAEQLFHVKQIEGEKYSMGDLLTLVPELNDTYKIIYGKSIMHELPKSHSKKSLIITDEVLNSFHMDKKRFKEFITSKSTESTVWNEDTSLSFTIMNIISPPFRYNILNDKVNISKQMHSLMHLPDLIIHYLILYNLSMISRYETEWWMELIKTTPNNDYPFIKTFLDITASKGPFLIHEYLINKKLNLMEK